MANMTGNSSCLAVSWGVSAVLGVGTGAVLGVNGALGPLLAVLTGGAICVAVGLLFSNLICQSQDFASSSHSSSRHLDHVSGLSEPNPSTHVSSADRAIETSPPRSEITSAIKSTQLPGTQELANRKGQWRYQRPSMS